MLANTGVCPCSECVDDELNAVSEWPIWYTRACDTVVISRNGTSIAEDCEETIERILGFLINVSEGQ